MYSINGHSVRSCYAGVDCFVVDDDRQCWDYTTLANWCGITVEELKEALWEQRFN